MNNDETQEDDDLDEENTDEDEQEDEDESDDEESGQESGDSEDSEDEDDPKLQAAIDRALAKREADAKKKREDNATRRIDSKKGLKGNRSDAENERLSGLEKWKSEREFSDLKRDFGYEHKLSPKETDIVFKFDKRPTAATLKEPAVRGAIEGIRQADAAKRNTPSTNGATFKVQGKSWNKMKPQERQASMADRRRSILDSKKG